MNNLYAQADHPVTCANPEYCFKIKEWKAERGNLYVRGENTIWFSSGLCKFHTEKDAIELNREYKELEDYREEERKNKDRGKQISNWWHNLSNL